MDRTAGMMLLCVCLGAAVMYGSTNFRIRVEPVAQPEAKVAPGPMPTPASEPGRLPENIIGQAERVNRLAAQPHVDPKVIPAQMGTTIVPITLILETVTVETSKTMPVRWKPRRPTDPSIPLITAKPTFTLAEKLDPTDKITATITQGNTVYTVSDMPTSPGWLKTTKTSGQFTTVEMDFRSLVPAPQIPLSGEVKISLEWTKTAKFVSEVSVRVPRDTTQPVLSTDQYFNSSFLDPKLLPAFNSPADLYGSFIQLRGRLFSQPSQFGFVVQLDPQSEVATDYPGDTLAAQPNFWSALPRGLLGFAEGTKGFIAVRADFGTDHAYAAQFLAFTAHAAQPPLKAPTIAIEKPGTTPVALTRIKDAAGQDTSVYASNTPTLTVKVTPAAAGASGVVLYVDGKAIAQPVTDPTKATPDTLSFPVTLSPAVKNVFSAVALRGDAKGDPAIAEVKVRTTGAVVESVLAPGFGQSGGVGQEKIAIRFNSENPLNPTSARDTKNYRVQHNEATTKTTLVKEAAFDATTNTVTLSVEKIVPGSYKIEVLNAGTASAPGLKDIYDNLAVKTLGESTEAAYETILFTAQIDQPLPSQRAGVTLQTGPAVVFPEYVKFRVSPDGFNPSDRVETRVARLYYYRDAHRVAQIVNRTVKSYNAATVDVRRRAADRVRDDANKAEDERKRLEYAAVKAAQDARAAEAELAAAQTRSTTARAQADQARQTKADWQFRLDQLIAAGRGNTQEAADIRAQISRIDQVISSVDTVDRQGPAEIARLQGAVAAKREAESNAFEAWQVKELQERRLRENQFRVEVAAAREDPDTYAPGNPDSNDPVMQVSVSVIGEGLIQLRGPIKGLNVIRTMINQIDAPVGQVRIAVHTLQVNGERADRMEKVVANIQRYLDHSRFLTAQSAQMLRRSVTLVAARKAYEVQQTLAPGWTQADRDQRYLYAFFGKDFTDELLQLDSEFLRTGNKLLSLHSMDSTSLSAALFLLALAKNDIRSEIINEFIGLVQKEMPEAEWNYYLAGISEYNHKCCEACKDKKQYLLAYNSKFQSFIGFFTSETPIADTLTPLQREFIRLAQIFKARMITEMQLKQRVMERALLEERVGTNYLEDLKKAKKLEDDAKAELATFQDSLRMAIAESNKGALGLLDLLNTMKNLTDEASRLLWDIFEYSVRNPISTPRVFMTLAKTEVPLPKVVGGKVLFSNAMESRKILLNSLSLFEQFNYLGRGNQEIYKRVVELLEKLEKDPDSLSDTELKELQEKVADLVSLIRNEVNSAQIQLNKIIDQLKPTNQDQSAAFTTYRTFRDDILTKLNSQSTLGANAKSLFQTTDPYFAKLSNAITQYQGALQKAQNARRPLDEKKLLDMMVDEMEDKFIEILEGTRAHTANIDNYMKTVTTALDDDFNTQYYLPSFRRAREASRYWDVTLAQIETTSVLCNNRSLGKVEPAATFEFDLPKRDILLTEGFRSAKALVDEYGALVNDPSFLALAKIYSGNPVSMMTGTGGNLSAVRNVLPGLPTSPDERVLAQGGPGRKEFGASLDALIPDPAIYKFETGTGYEIRPVLSPDGQAVVFTFNYLYTTDVREPVRADEKHLGRVKRHYVHTDVQLSNFELREVSKYLVSLKVARTGKGVQLLQDIPGVGILFRPLPSAAASLQQNLIYTQATIFPTLFDLMGLRYAPAIADLDPLAERMGEFAARNRRLDLEQRIYDIGATRVDDALRTPFGERRQDFYRSQISLPYRHPNGYFGPGLRLNDGTLEEGYYPPDAYPPSQFRPGVAPETRQPRYNLNTPYVPPYSPPAEYPLPEPRQMPSYPLPKPNPYPPSMTTPTGPSSGQLQMPATLPGISGPVNVARPVPHTPLPSAPPMSNTPKTREIPSTSFPPVITPGVPRPTLPTGPSATQPNSSYTFPR